MITRFQLELHMAAFLAGAVLDLITGDPHSIPHPVQWIGKLISVLEGRFLKRAERIGVKENDCRGQTESMTDHDGKIRRLKRKYGRWMAVIVVTVSMGVAAVILAVGYQIHPLLGWALETLMTCQILAGRSLQKESMKVYRKLRYGTLPEARKAVSMIVGRDTEHLSAEGVTKAAVETVAENTSDGVIAPMLYTALGGPVLGWAYKAVNTMDSMVGYRDERYLDFGRGPAHLDDAVNYLPSRISAVLMIAATWALEGIGTAGQWIRKKCRKKGPDTDGHETAFLYDAGQAAKIWKRDRRKHASPNSAQTEAVMAGALRVQLAGDAFYFGKLVRKPLIGDPVRPVCPEDIRRANHLMLTTAVLSEAGCIMIMLALA